jgi:hypothetical protein
MRNSIGAKHVTPEIQSSDAGCVAQMYTTALSEPQDHLLLGIERDGMSPFLGTVI